MSHTKLFSDKKAGECRINKLLSRGDKRVHAGLEKLSFALVTLFLALLQSKQNKH